MNTRRSLRIVTCSIAMLCLLSACGSTTSNHQGSHQGSGFVNYAKADNDYQMLVKRLRENANDPTKTAQNTQDFSAIVRVYPLTSDYDPYTGTEQAQKLIANQSMEAGNWTRCLIASNDTLQRNFTSITAHYGALVCAQEAGLVEEAVFHQAMLKGFMQAVNSSGNGRSPSSAFYITSANDLYAFIQLQGHIAVGQSLVYIEEKPIHAMAVRSLRNQKESTWYFDVTAPFRQGMLKHYEDQR